VKHTCTRTKPKGENGKMTSVDTTLIQMANIDLKRGTFAGGY